MAEAIKAVIDNARQYQPATSFLADALSDDALALLFSARHEHDLRFVNTWGRWLLWNGRRWEFDHTLAVKNLCREVAREVANEIMTQRSKDKLAHATASAKTVAAIERLARADRRHASGIDVWDSDPMLLNTPGGTVDLRTGSIRPHDRADLITRITAVAPGGDCPTWLAGLDRIFDGNVELIEYVQRALGYCLTGVTKEHALFVLLGSGGNGKSLIVNTFRELLGEYAVVAPMETFSASDFDRHPTELAMLRGARLVVANETEEGRKFSESRIKWLTGGDVISARFMRQDFFSFKPAFKLVIVGNHAPGFTNVDEAIRRRVHLIPFGVTIPTWERDPDLPEKLKAEWPGILSWAIQGCLQWQRQGLAQPPVVRDATGNYLADEDAITRFVNQNCVLGEPEALEEVQVLFAAWRDWGAATGEHTGSIKRFSRALDALKLVRVSHPASRRAAFRGIRLRAQGATNETGGHDAT